MLIVYYFLLSFLFYFRVCAEPLSINIMSNLYTLVEYYSVSNDQISKRMMIADAYPGMCVNVFESVYEYFVHVFACFVCVCACVFASM